VEYGPVFIGPTERRTYPIGAAFGEGFEFIGKNVEAISDLIGNLFQGKQNLGESVAGPVKIFKMSGQQFQLGPERFLMLMASLSVMLAILNILPIPALDGGHLVFVLIEGVIRREIPLKVRLAAQQVGIVLLLGFMIFVFYNDFSKM
jgi:regulator of sigma E protease